MFKSISAVLRGVTFLAGAGHAVSGFTKGEVFIGIHIIQIIRHKI